MTTRTAISCQPRDAVPRGDAAKAGRRYNQRITTQATAAVRSVPPAMPATIHICDLPLSFNLVLARGYNALILAASMLSTCDSLYSLSDQVKDQVERPLTVPARAASAVDEPGVVKSGGHINLVI